MDWDPGSEPASCLVGKTTVLGGFVVAYPSSPQDNVGYAILDVIGLNNHIQGHSITGENVSFSYNPQIEVT
jgi:hypothetical protein